MLVKQGLIGIQNGCIVVRGDLENIRVLLVGIVLSTAGGVLGSATVQRKLMFSVVQRCV